MGVHEATPLSNKPAAVKNIWVAASDGKMKVLKELIESGENDVNEADENGYTPL